ncbi:TAXI family TRAP transporter solute-binding subunit [Capilliphycus salinus ALCB114379]|uniref:TAXI family TRAP transporter solute-binding subunit n=1 Tax=Capilliphycus salinus TaxID=2768948 RepID=UPI0039A54EDC
MQKKIAFPLIGLSIILVLIFAVLSWKTPHQVYNLTLASAAKDGEYYAFSQAFSQVVSRHLPRLKINVIETEGSQQNLEFLKNKKADLALVQSDLSIPHQTKAVALLFPEMFHLIAREDSKINKVSDLKGKRIALMPKGSGSYNLFWVLSRHYGLNADDLKVVTAPPKEAYRLLEQGQVDALFRVIALGNPSINQLLQSGKSRLIPIEQATALQLFQPALEASTIPIGTYNGSIPIPAEDLPVVALRAVLITHKNVDDKVIYELTRILFEYRNELIAKTPQAAMIHQPESLKDLGFSFHPGAKDYYYQDEPTFLEKYAEPMGFVLSASVLVISSLWQFRLWFQGRQKNRADLYNLELISLIDQINSAQTIEELKDLRRQLFTIFKEVIVDLDKDRISSESFHSFTFTWEVAIASIRHQENLLRTSEPENHLTEDRKTISK